MLARRSDGNTYCLVFALGFQPPPLNKDTLNRRLSSCS